MTELAVGIATVLLTAVITYGVHIYRPKVGFEVRAESCGFGVSEGEITHHTERARKTIEIGAIKLINPSKTDVENFEIVFESPSPDAHLRVKSTKSLAKEAVRFDVSDRGIKISINRFPMKEQIDVIYSIIGYGGIEYVDPRKTDGKFELYSIRLRELAIQGFLSGLFYAASLAIISVAGALAFSLVRSAVD